MFAVCRLSRRLFLCLLVFAVQFAGQTIPMTTVQDTVYRADGSLGQGTLLISWPAFTTSSGEAIGAGSTSVNLTSSGTFSVALVPNVNATPPNTVYTVVYQLADAVKTEYWIVPNASPANLAAVRTTLGATSSVAQMATQQFVSSALAEKASDSTVVHLAGSETISGVKQFSVAPSLPTPMQPMDGANKAYVDSAVQNVGSGSYLSTTGGTMTGPITLSGAPAAPNQAANKQYVDMSAAVKADLIGGFVPAAELGSGNAGANTCLLGNQTWGACGAGGSSSYINSTLIANPNFNSASPVPQNNFLNCSFRNAGSNVSLECPYGNTSSSFALGSQAVLNNQANVYTAGLQDFSSASLKLPSGAGYAPSSSGAIGFDTSANAPVINISGLTQQLALTTSNISGQASTALALATTPTQCNGSFATGIQANGNANCGVADVIQLSETAQPAGIPNYGIFWFDSATHTPRIIDNNGQVEQLSLLNVFNSDANTLEEYNSTNPQAFNVYGTRSDAADYERLRLGFDSSTGYFFIGPDSGGTGLPRGLGIWLPNSYGNGAVRWAFDTAFAFKPFVSNSYSIGDSSHLVKGLYLGATTGLVFPSGSLTGVHGTTGIAAEAGALGTTAGVPLCNDGNGNVTDSGCATGSGNVNGPSSSVSGDFAAFNGTTGKTIQDSGIAISSLAALNSPIFTGTPQAPTPAATDNSGKLATTAYVQGQGYAPLTSPVFTGAPQAPTPATPDSSTNIATTAWVKAQGYGSSGSGSGTGSQSVNFTNVTNTSIALTYTTTLVAYACYDNLIPANSIFPNATLNANTYTVNFSFLVPQSGYCNVITGPSVFTASAYTLVSQEPPTTLPENVAGSVMNKKLPGDVMQHQWGNSSGGTNGDAIAKNALTDGGNYPDTARSLLPFIWATPGSCDTARPDYYPTSSDPWYEITGASPSGPRTAVFHAPNGATSSHPDATCRGGYDQSMNIWDQATGYEISIYRFGSNGTPFALPPATSCGSTQSNPCSITGFQYVSVDFWATDADYGEYGSGGTASAQSPEFAGHAGQLRRNELAQGQINHALIATVDCVHNVTNPYVFPATGAPGKCTGTGNFGADSSARPMAGMLLFNDYTQAQIAAMSIPSAAKTFLYTTSMNGGYGIYVAETAGLYTILQIGGNEEEESGQAFQFYTPSYNWTNDSFVQFLQSAAGDR